MKIEFLENRLLYTNSALDLEIAENNSSSFNFTESPSVTPLPSDSGNSSFSRSGSDETLANMGLTLLLVCSGFFEGFFLVDLLVFGWFGKNKIPLKQAVFTTLVAEAAKFAYGPDTNNISSATYIEESFLEKWSFPNWLIWTIPAIGGGLLALKCQTVRQPVSFLTKT